MKPRPHVSPDCWCHRCESWTHRSRVHVALDWALSEYASVLEKLASVDELVAGTSPEPEDENPLD